MAEKKGSAKLLSPLYEGGRTNGPVAGPRGGKNPSDPLGYQTQTGDKAPGGSPADRTSGDAGERATAK